MNTKEFTCVVCPNGCPIVVNIDEDAAQVIAQIQGSVCKRGEEWAHQEIKNPMRTIASSIPVKDGNALMASVRTNRPIPLAKILQVIEEIKKVTVNAPVSIGEVILRNPADCDTEIVATRSIERVH
jgi:CxxC motif-containing protein